MNDIKNAFFEKEQCLKNPADYKLIEQFYHTLRNYSLKELVELFPAPMEIKAQNLFDYTNEILGKSSVDSMLNVSIDMFDPDTIEKNKDETFEKDLKLLQSLFFFLIKEISEKLSKDYSKLFLRALASGDWKKASKQADILNKISSDLDFNTRNPFVPCDFTKLGSVHYKANESILRLFFNFWYPDLYAKEGIVNELNFVREQQNNILPVYPNTNKTNWKPKKGNEEAETTKENLTKLKALDFGFKDSDYTQSFFIGNEELKKTFIRPVDCKCFPESELEWEIVPQFIKRKRKIIAVKSERSLNKASLYNKFLYLERNILTHVGDITPVYKLFSKTYKSYEKKFWEELLLESMYDVKEYILTVTDNDARNKLMTILNHYFKKITKDVCPENQSVEERWNTLFDSDGNLDIDPDDYKKTDISNILETDERTHFKRFMGLMYCSENDDNDFFERNCARIQLYLIHLSLSLSLMDV